MRQNRRYRGIFTKADGARVRLDFYAENKTFALVHAHRLALVSRGPNAEHGPLTVHKVVTQTPAGFDAGSFHPYEDEMTPPVDDGHRIYVAIGPNVWGKGFTEKQALDAAAAESREARRHHIIYATSDPWAYVDDMGSLMTRRRAKTWEVARKGVKSRGDGTVTAA